MKRILVLSFCCWLLVITGCRTTAPLGKTARLTSPPAATAAPSPTHPTDLVTAVNSPDLSNIIFISGNRLYALDVNMQQVKQLKAKISGYFFDVELSPDRQQIALVFTGSMVGGIYLVNADGSEPKLLYHHRQSYDEDFPTGLVWSPDSQRIAFEHKNVIYIVGTNISRAIENPWPDGEAVQIAPGAQVVRIPKSGSHPDWSPDGEQLVFRTLYGKSIDSIDLRNRAETQLTHNVDDEWSPVWSPDGQHIAFISDRNGQDDIYLIDADGSNERQLTDTPEQERDLAWSLAGQQLLCRSENSIFVIKADGSGQKLLVSGVDGGYVQSPDGRRIAFVDDKTMYMMDIDGSNPTKLLSWPEGFGSFDW